MGPSRTKPSAGNSSGEAIPYHGAKQQKSKRHRPYTKQSHQPEDDTLPGVQKLKASLRQTRRLLAKENLGADVRVETERRLKALEADLARAEEAKKERTFAVRYHKVKFFERQKVSRKINQAKRGLSSAEGKEKKKLERTLRELRIDLNYILHFPKSKKYISLFPPEARKVEANSSDPGPSTSNTKLDDNDQRNQLRAWIREQMDGGELSGEPEIELGKTDGGVTANATKATSREKKAKTKSMDGADVSGKKKNTSTTAKKPEKPMDVAGDEFFGNDSDGESGGEARDDQVSDDPGDELVSDDDEL
ncbi:hypothetical protein BV22DRAFT_1030482 [Leucogyrophana mollusca]|uniref:Uncharacterized protein n=1 Tax=Leucogyrophana mollusca TaxID=85980 RepID=A0ACB8BRX4_9AGAM|nr:hypothetical protein BV22DRAFT_1030482 [Leucogyrophana mollusca]